MLPGTPMTTSFQPETMKIGVLTAALQELTPREQRRKDPDRAVEDWIRFGREIGVRRLQLSSALPEELADVPPEAMLDPVADHLDVRRPLDAARLRRIETALAAAEMSFSDLAYFDNMLIGDERKRRIKHDWMIKLMDAAAALGARAVCGFVGRNVELDMDQNLEMFERAFVPLLQAARERGLEYRVEQCPMPGWNTTDAWHNNIGYTPGMWIRLHRIAEKHKCGDAFRIHYDPSHAILMGQNTRDLFQFLKDQGYNFLISGFHVKGQVINPRGLAEWGYGGQTCDRGDRKDGKPDPDVSKQSAAWLKQVVLATHELPGTARHDPLAYLQNRSVDWLDHQLAARELLEFKGGVGNVDLVVEHEYPDARVQDPKKLAPILQGSIAFTRAIDEAAANMIALWKVLEGQGIAVQGVGRQAYRS
jgi:sugar phosphate isomerase/epimerase